LGQIFYASLDIIADAAVQFHVFAEGILNGPMLHGAAVKKRWATFAGHVDDEIGLGERGVAQAFRELAFDGQATFGKHRDRGFVDKTDRLQACTLGDDYVGGIAAGNRFRHLAADAVAYANE
jgi:hypothetical protein